jgi:hypothetical protein
LLSTACAIVYAELTISFLPFSVAFFSILKYVYESIIDGVLTLIPEVKAKALTVQIRPVGPRLPPLAYKMTHRTMSKDLKAI